MIHPNIIPIGRNAHNFLHKECGLRLSHIRNIDPENGDALWDWNNENESALFFCWLSTIAMLQIKDDAPPDPTELVAAVRLAMGEKKQEPPSEDRPPPFFDGPAPAPPVPRAQPQPPAARATPQPKTPARTGKVSVADVYQPSNEVRDNGMPPIMPGVVDNQNHTRPKGPGGGIDTRTGKVIAPTKEELRAHCEASGAKFRE